MKRLALLIVPLLIVPLLTVLPAQAAPNTQQNRVFRDAVRACERTLGVRLGKGDVRLLHESITGQNMNFHELVEECVAMFWSRKTRKPKGTGGAEVLLWVGMAVVVSAISTPVGVTVSVFGRPVTSRGLPCPADSITSTGRCLV